LGILRSRIERSEVVKNALWRLAQALASGAVFAPVAHAMIPVALEEGGSLVVLPTVVGFLFAL
jgi:hypothetical protein